MQDCGQKFLCGMIYASEIHCNVWPYQTLGLCWMYLVKGIILVLSISDALL